MNGFPLPRKFSLQKIVLYFGYTRCAGLPGQIWGKEGARVAWELSPKARPAIFELISNHRPLKEL